MTSRYVDYQEIEDFLVQLEYAVEEWHNGGGFGMELHSYLALTWTEFSYYIEHPQSFAHAKILEKKGLYRND